MQDEIAAWRQIHAKQIQKQQPRGESYETCEGDAYGPVKLRCGSVARLNEQEQAEGDRQKIEEGVIAGEENEHLQENGNPPADLAETARCEEEKGHAYLGCQNEQGGGLLSAERQFIKVPGKGS